jgi:hypothetical protein
VPARPEWSDDGALPADPGTGASPQEPGPPDWADGGNDAFRNDNQAPWDDLYLDEPAPTGQYQPGVYQTVPDGPYQRDSHWPAPDDQYQRGPYPTAPYRPASGRRGRRPARRSLVITAVAVAVVAAGASAALARNRGASMPQATGPSASAPAGHGTVPGAGRVSPSAVPGPQDPPAISKADAENVVASYSQVNNKANAAYSDSLLSTIEGGSSYTMDAGAYRFELGQSGRPAYVPFQLTGATYYIPRMPQGSYPRWFTVKATYTTTAAGKTLATAYIVFAQDAAGAAWKDVTEPDILPGQSPPQIAVDSSGYAQAVPPNAGGLNVAPGKIGQVTAEWLDQLAASKSDSVIKDESGNLTDLQDEVFWRSGQGGTTLNATDTHSAPAGQVFALRTTSGGALVFYATAAQLTLTEPNGAPFGGLNIPGYYSAANSAGLTSATVGYVEQFATYIPPAGSNARDVVADISSIASRD